MNIIMFIVGGGIFTSFIIGVIWEAKNEEKPQTENYENYGGEGWKCWREKEEKW